MKLIICKGSLRTSQRIELSFTRKTNQLMLCLHNKSGDCVLLYNSMVKNVM